VKTKSIGVYVELFIQSQNKLGAITNNALTAKIDGDASKAYDSYRISGTNHQTNIGISAQINTVALAFQTAGQASAVHISNLDPAIINKFNFQPAPVINDLGCLFRINRRAIIVDDDGQISYRWRRLQAVSWSPFFRQSACGCRYKRF